MRLTHSIMVLFALAVLLVGCREDDTRLDDPLRSQPVTLVAPNVANAVPGCETGDLENWLETTLPNAQAFRDESFGYITLPPDQVQAPISRLSDLSGTIYALPVPECASVIHSTLIELMRAMLDSLVAYSEGRIDQAQLLTDVTAQQARYDSEIKPRLDETTTILDERYAAESQ